MAGGGSDARRRRPPCCRWPCSPSPGPRAWPPPARRLHAADSADAARRHRGPRAGRPRPGQPDRPAHPRPRASRPRSGVVSTASASGIPAVALAAYQRAATVIDAADRSCHLPWQLVAAIGRVESDHGRTGGNVLTDQGVAEPGHLRPRARRPARHVDDPRHRRRAVRPGRPLRPGRRPDAVHPVDAGRSSGSTPTTTAGATRRTSTTPRSAPRSTSAPGPTTSSPTPDARSGLPLQPQPAVRRAGAGDHGGPTWPATSRRCPTAPRRPASRSGRRRRRSRPGTTHVTTAAGTTGATPRRRPSTTAPTSGPPRRPTSGPTGDPTADPTSDPTGGLPTKLPTQLPTQPPDRRTDDSCPGPRPSPSAWRRV